MGVFLQNALFPGCDEVSARVALEEVAKNSDYFGSISQEERQRLAGNPAVLMGWFPVREARVRFCS